MGPGATGVRLEAVAARDGQGGTQGERYSSGFNTPA